MPKTTSFVLGDHFDQFVAHQLKSGRYGSTSEIIREGLRLVEERTKVVEALNAELNTGLESGIASDFSWDAIKARGRQDS
jgi:antitoxin ParD1/3/4